MRLNAAALFALGLLACGRFVHRHAPDASSSATPLSDPLVVEEEEDETVTSDGGACPIAIHPGYCRRSCRDFSSRSRSKHARRMTHAARVGLGKCDDLDVFAEDEEAGDAGVKSGIVEFFDHKDGQLVGALDTRSKPCGEFGRVPKCTPVIAWEESHSLSVKAGEVKTSSGRLPVEVIQRIVRQNFGRFRLCYLNGNHTAQGRVVVKFVIGKDGSVSSVQDGGSDLKDDAVTSCVLRSFSNLSFPEPEGGTVTVTFPLVFTH